MSNFKVSVDRQDSRRRASVVQTEKLQKEASLFWRTCFLITNLCHRKWCWLIYNNIYKRYGCSNLRDYKWYGPGLSSVTFSKSSNVPFQLRVSYKFVQPPKQTTTFEWYILLILGHIYGIFYHTLLTQCVHIVLDHNTVCSAYFCCCCAIVRRLLRLPTLIHVRSYHI